jgi:hypothetical protein
MARARLNALILSALPMLAGPALSTQVQPTAAVVWNKAALAEVRLTRQGPPIAARALAVAHTCMYESWVP